MAQIPGPKDKITGSEESQCFPDESPVAESEEVENLLLQADMWCTDWRLNEFDFDKETREAEHKKYIQALRKACRDYSNKVCAEFPLGVARWLAQEADSICSDLPSQILKRPFEGSRTAGFHHENAFDLSREEWEKQRGNNAFVLQALSYAHDKGVLPPGWVIQLLVEAGAKVYESDGELEFGEALGLTPKKIKEARTGQRKRAFAELVAEAIDAGLRPAEARELAVAEAETVYGWDQLAPSTVQKYYENFAKERDGFGETFMWSLMYCGYNQDPVFQSFRLPYWRRKVLKTRLEAYREAQDSIQDRAEIFQFVVTKTVDALRRVPPPKNDLEYFIESDF